MNTTLKISKTVMVCVLGGVMSATAYGAPSVRALGGAGTYSGTTAATSGNIQSAKVASPTTTNVARGGSLRVSPTTATSTAAAPVKITTTAAPNRAASQPRLSIGKYLNNKYSVSGATNAGAASSANKDDINDIKNNITDMGNALKDKQDQLTEGDYITIDDNDTIDVNVEQLVNDIAEKEIYLSIIVSALSNNFIEKPTDTETKKNDASSYVLMLGDEGPEWMALVD